jgi:uncharacterized membrane protein YoaK (UPF0700 family)
MHTLNNSTLAFAIGLSMLAGCADAIGYMQMGGYFISFMSGNSTRLAVGLQHGDWQMVATLVVIIFCFTTGAGIGAALRNHALLKHKTASVLTLVASLLLIGALCDSSGMRFTAMLIIALAMGAENSILQSNGDNVIGVTYMTGTLVKIGQRIAGAFQGNDRLSWIPYLLLWLGLIVGGIAGAFLFVQCEFNALWFPTVWAGLLAALQWRSK